MTENKNTFLTLPEELFDNILKYIDIIDIINFSNTSKENLYFVKKITNNKNSQLSKTYNIINIIEFETWVNLSQKMFKMNFIKQIYDIYSRIGKDYILEFNEVKKIFINLSQMMKNIYEFDNKKENNLAYKYIIETIIKFIANNNYIFDCNKKNRYFIKEKILNTIFRIYGRDFHFLNDQEYYDIETIILDMYQEIIDRLEYKSVEEKKETFIFNYLECFFLYTQDDEYCSFKNIDYIRECLEEMVIQSGMGEMFIE
jgi:hypothetical protein